MDRARALLRRLRELARRDDTSSEIREELEFHIARQTEENIARGMSPSAAREAAMKEFGGLGAIEEDCHDARGFAFVESLADDVRYAVRLLRKQKTFTIGAVTTIALAIAAATTMFSVVHGVLLRPLPYPDADRIVAVYEEEIAAPGPSTLSPPNYLDLRDQSRRVRPIAAYHRGSYNVAGGRIERANALLATPELFSVLRVAPLHGRTFNATDEQVIVLSHAMAVRQFGSATRALNQPLEVDGVRKLVIGVMPAGFAFPNATIDFWLPLRFGADVQTQRGAHFLGAIGRLADGASVESARSELATIAARLAAAHPRSNEGTTMSAQPLRALRTQSARRGLMMLSGAVLLFALLACANIANLLLARAASREQEAAIRHALGASRRRLIRQFLTEAFVLAMAGGSVGVLLAMLCAKLIATYGPRSIPRIDSVAIDAPAMLFALAAIAITSILFGVVPAFRASRGDIAGMIGSGGTRVAGKRGRRRVHALLAGTQIAVAVMLLTGATLLLRSFQAIAAVPPGFDPKSVLTFSVSLPESYDNSEKTNVYFDELLRRVRALPGVTSAGAVTPMPLGGGSFSSSIRIDGRAEEESESAMLFVADGAYLRTLRVPLLRGTLFDDREELNGPRSLLITESAVRRYFAGRDPIGSSVKFGARGGYEKIEGRIIGVVADVRHDGLDQEIQPAFYAARRQGGMTEMTIAVRTSVPPKSLAPAIARELAAIDRGVALAELQTVEELLDESLSKRRFQTSLLGAFALAALILAIVGTYAVIAYSVTQRTSEIGVRMALGSTPAGVFALVLREAIGVVVAGVIAGLLGSLLLQRLIASMLYGISATDTVTFALVALAVILVAIAAASLPARRATRVDPMMVLRGQ